eukprot:1603275-Amphidinium_carterae.1
MIGETFGTSLGLWWWFWRRGTGKLGGSNEVSGSFCYIVAKIPPTAVRFVPPMCSTTTFLVLWQQNHLNAHVAAATHL